MTTALHLATQFTSLLATITTIAATTHVLSMWLVLPVFFTLQVGILVFLLISASLPPITSVRIRITTLVAVEASLWFLWASTHQIGGGLGLEGEFHFFLSFFVYHQETYGGYFDLEPRSKASRSRGRAATE